MLALPPARLGADPHDAGGDAETERAMTPRCIKCQGLLVLRQYYDFFETCFSWRCVNCGLILDRVIAENRRKSMAGSPGLDR